MIAPEVAEAIATMVNAHVTESNHEPREVGDRIEALVRDLATALMLIDPNLNRHAFLRSCGIEP